MPVPRTKELSYFTNLIENLSVRKDEPPLHAMKQPLTALNGWLQMDSVTGTEQDVTTFLETLRMKAEELNIDLDGNFSNIISNLSLVRRS